MKSFRYYYENEVNIIRAFYRYLAIPISEVIASRVPANFLTILMMFLTVGGGLLFFNASYITNIIAIAFIQVGVFIDFMDGNVARKRNTASNYGAWLDITSDKFADFVVFLGITFNAFIITNNPFFLLVGFVAIGTRFLIETTMLYGQKYGDKINIGKLGFSRHFAHSLTTAYFFLIFFVILDRIPLFLMLLTLYNLVSYAFYLYYLDRKINKKQNSKWLHYG